MFPYTVAEREAFNGFQILWASIGMQEAHKLLKEMFQMTQQQNSQTLADKLTWIEDSMHNVIPKNNIV